MSCRLQAVWSVDVRLDRRVTSSRPGR